MDNGGPAPRVRHGVGMGRTLQALDPALRGEPFSTRTGRAHGATRSRLRAADLISPIRGFRIHRDDDDLTVRLRAYALHRRRDFAFSHITAARLYGIPLPGTASSDIHVSVRAPGRAPDIRGFVGHQLRRWETWSVGDVPVTTPPQTWLDLAPMLSVAELIVAADFLVGTKASLSSTAELREAITQSPGRRGIARARLALERARVGSESPGETHLRLLLAHAGLPEPVLNLGLYEATGGFVARVDMAYRDARVALEYEGDVHRVDRRTWMKDIRRRERIEDLGWRVVRVTASDLRDPDDLLRRLRRQLGRP